MGRVFTLLPRYLWIVTSEIICAANDFLVRDLSPSHKNVWIENNTRIIKCTTNYNHLSLYFLKG